MFSDIKVIFENDPAAKNIFEVLMYQGLWAVLFTAGRTPFTECGSPFFRG